VTGRTTEENLRRFGAIVSRLIRREDISRAEAKECWRQICMREQPSLQQGAFIAAALAAKPETLDEIAGTFDALYEFDTTKVEIDTPEPFIDNAGAGGDTLKTLHITIGCLNAAPLLYVMDQTGDLVEGVEAARAAISDGRAMQKLRDWVASQNADRAAGIPKLERMLAEL
jgi:anthranilate phosphoribosyltransferase